MSLSGVHKVGKEGYLDPEHTHGQGPQPTGDVYSLGVLMLELLTGLPAVDKFLSPVSLVERLRRPLHAAKKRGGPSLGDVTAGGWPLGVYREWVRLVLACVEPRSTVLHSSPLPRCFSPFRTLLRLRPGPASAEACACASAALLNPRHTGG
jgi:serine/threonine protein kinase